MLVSHPVSKVDPRAKVNYFDVLVFIFIIVIDQLSKLWVNYAIPLMVHSEGTFPYGGISVWKNFLGTEFSITHMTNEGAAWGVLGQYQLLLICVRVGLILATITYLLFFNSHAKWKIPLVLVVAGAIGNVIDFFVYGHVIDMFHFVLWGYDAPVFNVADSMITTGIALLLILSRFV